MAAGAAADLAQPDGHLLCAAGVVLGHDHLGQPRTGVQQRGRDRHRVLRLQKKPGQRCADGQGAVRRPHRGGDVVAHHAVPPDPVDGLCGAGAALRQEGRLNPACCPPARGGCCY